jgi:hypothetical protein
MISRAECEGFPALITALRRRTFAAGSSEWIGLKSGAKLAQLANEATLAFLFLILRQAG